MKNKITIFILAVLLPCFINAQEKGYCDFEQLFSVKPGMDMPGVITVLQQNSKITLLKNESKMLKPPASGGDSILHETVTYRIDSSKCIKGRDNFIKFEFADGKLFKAYLETTYGTNEFNELMANFDFLHKQILQSWPVEKGMTLKGNGTNGSGYTFTDKPGKNPKLNICMLQYIKTTSSNPNNDKYKLEILWANLNNTRMENTAF